MVFIFPFSARDVSIDTIARGSANAECVFGSAALVPSHMLRARVRGQLVAHGQVGKRLRLWVEGAVVQTAEGVFRMEKVPVYNPEAPAEAVGAAEVMLSAQVSASYPEDDEKLSEVKVLVRNVGDAAVDLANGTLRVVVTKWE